MLRTLPQLADVNTDQQDKGLESNLVIDRNTAARFGISPQLIDDTLYDAFGQRQVSTMYTQLEAVSRRDGSGPRFWQNPGRAPVHLRPRLAMGARCRSAPSRTMSPTRLRSR